MRKLHAAVIASALALVTATSASCLDPTEVTLDVTTDVPCKDTKGTTFTGGAAGTTEGAVPNTTTDHCVDGAIGTLVATPADSKDTVASFVIVLGVDRPVSECTLANHYKGCVVQRRWIAYAKHKPIHLPISMWLVCKDVQCDSESTCARNGKCVPARITDPGNCGDGTCYPDGDTPDVPPVEAGVDGAGGDGATDGPLGDGAGGDGATDGATDAPLFDSAAPPTNRLFCPPVDQGCFPGSTCCWSTSGVGGHCNGCVANDIPLLCNRKTDCTVSQLCCATLIAGVGMSLVPNTVTGSSCMNYPGLCPGAWLCLDTTDCPAPMTCDKTTPDFAPTGVFGECK